MLKALLWFTLTWPSRETRYVKYIVVAVLLTRFQTLGVEMLKLFKNERTRFSPFAVALLLAIGKGQSNTKFEQQIFDLLRASIVNSFKGDSAMKEIAWFKGNYLVSTRVCVNALPDFEQNDAMQQKSSKAIIAPSLLSAIKNSENGWDATVKVRAHRTSSLSTNGNKGSTAIGPRIDGLTSIKGWWYVNKRV